MLPEKVSELQEQWNKIYAEEGRGKIIDVRIDGAQEKLAGFAKRAGSIIRAAGMSCPITPESIAYIYEENKKRNLEWRCISEKNRQHDEYEREMNKAQIGLGVVRAGNECFIPPCECSKCGRFCGKGKCT